jgi:hypothetical protein
MIIKTNLFNISFDVESDCEIGFSVSLIVFALDPWTTFFTNRMQLNKKFHINLILKNS